MVAELKDMLILGLRLFILIVCRLTGSATVSDVVDGGCGGEENIFLQSMTLAAFVPAYSGRNQIDREKRQSAFECS
jgi:hypothetical protein